MTTQSTTGLTDEEVQASRKQYGSNSLGTEHNHRFWRLVKDIVTEPLFIILIVAAIIYLVLGEYQEGIIMLLALGFVSGISLYQENMSRSAVEALKKLSSPKAKVIRNSHRLEIETEEVVVGDVITVADGDIIPADAEIIELHDFSVNESILTGEALAVSKELNSPLNRVYQGTMVTGGMCLARVTAVGRQTAFGKIGKQLQDIEVTKTPLQRQIKNFVRSMVIVGAVAFIIVWGLNYYLTKSILQGLLRGLTLAMSILPEEIPVAFSTFMALGAYHLYKQKVIVRNPHTVETLGTATVICVDKTGTITENRMQLCAIYDYTTGNIFDYTNTAFTFNPVLEYAMWASESEPFDMMEKSIHQAYSETTPKDIRADYTIFREYPLSGTPPVMTHVFSNGKGHYIIACKGSVEGVLAQCNLPAEKLKEVKNQVMAFASKGFRVLGVASSQAEPNNLPQLQQDFKLDFKGLVAFYDPPKPNMAGILQQFYKAGIGVKMITGDYPETALAIAQQINFKNSGRVLTGEEIMKLDEAALRQLIPGINLFARMFPDAKLRIIEALKANGEIVGMTGDGVNDGPALKAAHIGIAMGKRGSEIAKDASSLILADDDLAHMVDAVALGRRIYENLKKAIRYIISIHIPIILIVTIPLLLFWQFTDFFSPIHVIFLELIMGPTCSIIFENEPIEANSMDKPPRAAADNFFSLRELSLSIIQGLAVTAVCLGPAYYLIKTGSSEMLVRTFIYSTLIFSNLFLTITNRSFYYSVLTTIRYRNWLIPLVLVLSVVVLMLSIYVNAVSNIFRFQPLSVLQLAASFGAAFVGVMWVEIYKIAVRMRAQKVPLKA